MHFLDCFRSFETLYDGKMANSEILSNIVQISIVFSRCWDLGVYKKFSVRYYFVSYPKSITFDCCYGK